jgi:hypothetical protein
MISMFVSTFPIFESNWRVGDMSFFFHITWGNMFFFSGRINNYTRKKLVNWHRLSINILFCASLLSLMVTFGNLRWLLITMKYKLSARDIWWAAIIWTRAGNKTDVTEIYEVSYRGTPKSSIFVSDLMLKTIQLLGYPHSRNPPIYWACQSWVSSCWSKIHPPWFRHKTLGGWD